MLALVIMVVFFLIAVAVSAAIPYRPNNPGTTARRIWFWVLCVVAAVVGFVVNYIIGTNITVPSIQSSYYMHSGIAAGVSALLYIFVGFGISKIFPKSKVGTWF